jgi:hypothetical protein
VPAVRAVSWRDSYSAIPPDVMSEIVAEARRTMPEESSDAVLCAELHRVADELRRRGMPVVATIELTNELFDARLAEIAQDAERRLRDAMSTMRAVTEIGPGDYVKVGECWERVESNSAFGAERTPREWTIQTEQGARTMYDIRRYAKAEDLKR